MQFKFKKLNKKAALPEYATEQSAGMDVRACLDQPITLKPLQRKLIPTGIAAEIPEGYELQVRARSGLALRHGIALVNGIGTIDSDYRGEIVPILINLGEEDFIINHGDRIAQFVIAAYEKVEIVETNKLSSAQRGDKGLGSTGIK